MMDGLGLSGDDIVKILGTGIAGLSFLFVVFSYVLLRKEQDREGEPREKMLKYINRFTYTTLVFAILVGLFTLFDNPGADSGDISDDCREQLERAAALLKSDHHTTESLKQLYSNTIGKCI